MRLIPACGAPRCSAHRLPHAFFGSFVFLLAVWLVAGHAIQAHQPGTIGFNGEGSVYSQNALAAVGRAAFELRDRSRADKPPSVDGSASALDRFLSILDRARFGLWDELQDSTQLRRCHSPCQPRAPPALQLT